MPIIEHNLRISNVTPRNITDMALAKDPGSSPWTFKLRTAPIAGAATRDMLAETPPRRRKLAADEIIILLLWGELCGIWPLELRVGDGQSTQRQTAAPEAAGTRHCVVSLLTSPYSGKNLSPAKERLSRP